MDRREFERAVRSSWTVRQSQASRQEAAGRTDAGRRGAVTGGAHLDALAALFAEIFLAASFDRACVRTRASVELPGYYRPTKKWDLVVVERDRLVAAMEFKSQVGPSFGNNFNNRVEEALGRAAYIRALPG